MAWSEGRCCRQLATSRLAHSLCCTASQHHSGMCLTFQSTYCVLTDRISVHYAYCVAGMRAATPLVNVFQNCCCSASMREVWTSSTKKQPPRRRTRPSIISRVVVGLGTPLEAHRLYDCRAGQIRSADIKSGQTRADQIRGFMDLVQIQFLFSLRTPNPLI